MPLPRTALILVAAAGALGAWSCTGEDGAGGSVGAKGAESDPIDDFGKSDTIWAPTEHGAVEFGAASDGRLTGDARFHVFDFELFGPADVALATGQAAGGARKVDTVMYLYRLGDSGYGRYLLKNDDGPDGGVWSALEASLDAGSYRVLVKGYADSTVGAFALTVDCAGEGCSKAGAGSGGGGGGQEPVEVAECLFGDTFSGLREGETSVRVLDHRTLTSADGLSDLERRQVLAAVQVAYEEAQTAGAAFEAVDDGRIERYVLLDEAGSRTFLALEYGAGDNSYGAIVRFTSPEVVATIQDGDLYACTVDAQTCLFGGSAWQIEENPAFTTTASHTLTAESELDELRARQVLIAAQVAYPELTSVEEAFDTVDSGEALVDELTRKDTGEALVMIEVGAGDNSFGKVFFAGTTDTAATIVDGDLDDCAVFAP